MQKLGRYVSHVLTFSTKNSTARTGCYSKQIFYGLQYSIYHAMYSARYRAMFGP